MKLGNFDKDKAVFEATAYLKKSIFILSSLINIGEIDMDELTKNPYDDQHVLYNSFECLRSEITAYNRLSGHQ